MGSLASLERRVRGGSPEETQGQFPGTYLAELSGFDGDNDGLCFFTIPDFSRTIEFGPAHYPRPPIYTQHQALLPGNGDNASLTVDDHKHRIVPQGDEGIPPIGTELVVSFILGDPDRPEVLKVKGWLE